MLDFARSADSESFERSDVLRASGGGDAMSERTSLAVEYTVSALR